VPTADPPHHPPGDFDALMKLGNLFFKQGDHDAALQRFQQASRLRPNNAAAHYNVGLVLQHQGKFEQAIGSYQQALQFQPDLLVAANNLGAALKSLGRLDEAVACYRQILRHKPDFADAHANLGNALAMQEKLDEAVSCYQQALHLRPDSVQTHFNLGFALSQHGRVDEASRHFRETLRLKPDHLEAQYNLGIILHEQGKLDDALALYEQVLRAQPGHGGAHLNRAFMWLVRGNWAQGWPEYEWRWQLPDFAQRHFVQPAWDGSALGGRTILLYAEQGLGDTFQFLRYVPLVQQRGGRVILQCQPALLRLLANLPGIDCLVPKDSPLPRFDVHAALLSLPGILRTAVATVPATIPYLSPKAELVERWRKELRRSRTSEVESRKSNVERPKSEEVQLTSDIRHPTSDFLVGIAWQGNPVVKDDRQRSIALARFARLAQVPGVQLISLQKGPGMEQLHSHATVLDLGSRLDEASGPFMDTAAVMMNLDLVISCDTAIPHLAGALGIPVWVAVSLIPDWRWLLEREDSPWYPTMRLFRQTRYADWDDVFERIAEELKAVASCQLSVVRKPITDN